MKLKNLLSILVILPFLCSCQEDDIEEIFVESGTWNVGNFYTGGKWERFDNDGARAIYQKNEDLKVLNRMTVTFHDDGTVSGTLVNGTFTARWEANGKDRTIRISNMKPSNTPTGKSKELVDALSNAAFYKGDTNYLKIAPEDKKSYVQLGHYSE